jgi:hypothetical protein
MSLEAVVLDRLGQWGSALEMVQLLDFGPSAGGCDLGDRTISHGVVAVICDGCLVVQSLTINITFSHPSALNFFHNSRT